MSLFFLKAFLSVFGISFSFIAFTQNQINNDSISVAFDKKDYEFVISEYEKRRGESNKPKLQNKELELIGKSYYFLEKYAEALPILKHQLRLSITRNENFNAYANCYYIFMSHKALFERDSALHYSKISLRHAELTKSDLNISRALNNVATIYEERSEYSQSIQYYQKSLMLVGDDSIEFMQTRSNISSNYFKIGLLDSAFSIASEAYEFFTENHTQPYWKWLSTYRIAYIEKDYKNELAYGYYRELLKISDNNYRRTLAQIGLGESFYLKGSDSAIYYFNNAKIIAESSNNTILQREVFLNLAKLYLTLNPNQTRLKDAIDKMNLILGNQGDKRAEPLLRIYESGYFLNENRLEESLNSINHAVQLATKYNNKDRLAEALTQKFNVLNHFSRYKEALAVKEEEIKVREELFNDRSEAVYQILRTQNEMDKQESTIANQQLEIDNNNLQILIMYISIALVISALVFIFWQYRTRSKYAKKLETMFLDSRHRYMNNLLLLKNWFNEGKTEKNDEIISFAQNRIDAISTVNRHLDRLSYNKDTIASRSFLEDISHNLLANREFTSDIQDVPINMSVSGPLGMITNEIITNGLKYGEEPYAIRFHKNGGGYTLEIEDHGPGITDPEKKGTGSKVLKLLSRQLKGELTYQNKADHSSEGRGTLVSLQFKG